MRCIVVSHTRWDREWYDFLLDGQSVVLED